MNLYLHKCLIYNFIAKTERQKDRKTENRKTERRKDGKTERSKTVRQ